MATKTNPFDKNVGKLNNPLLDSDETFKQLSKPLENDARRELGKSIEKPAVTAATPPIKPESKKEEKIKKAALEKAEAQEAAPKHPLLTGGRKSTVYIYDNLLELLRLLKLTNPEAENITEVSNELILAGLEAKGWLKDLVKLQATIKK